MATATAPVKNQYINPWEQERALDQAPNTQNSAPVNSQETYNAWNTFLGGTPKIEYNIVEEAQKIVDKAIKESEKAEVESLTQLERIAKQEKIGSFETKGSLSFAEHNREVSSLKQENSQFFETNPDFLDQPQDLKVDLKKSSKQEKLVDFKLFGEVMSTEASKAAKATYKNTVEFGKAVKSLFTEYVLFKAPKPKTEKEKAADAKKKVQGANKQRFFDQLRQAGTFLKNKSKAFGEKIANLNKQRGSKNLSFEGVLDNKTGEVNKATEADIEKTNSQKTQEQIRQEKRSRFQSAMGSKSKKGPGITMSADKSHNFNNASKLTG